MSANKTAVQKARIRSLMEQGSFKQALTLLDKLVKRTKKDPEAWFVRGMVYSKLGAWSKATVSFRRATSLLPSHVLSHYNLALSLKMEGKNDDAACSLKRAIELDPKHAQSLRQLAQLAVASGNTVDAVLYYEKLVEISPSDTDLLADLGGLYYACGQLQAAAGCYERAIAAMPACAKLYNDLAGVLCGQGMLEEAIERHREAIMLAPQDRRSWSNYLLTLNYLPASDGQELSMLHRQWGEGVEKQLGDALPATRSICVHQQRLKIGYVSPDYRTHSVAYFIEPLLVAHNRNVVEVYCYAASSYKDATTRRLQQAVEHWRDISSLTDKAAAARIIEDGIDVLVDLSGHTAGSRLALFALQPAPVQMSYLGYPNTTGLPRIHYRLTDALADPEGSDQYYTEQLLRLPGCFLCYMPPDDAPEVSSAPCLENGYVTFGSFNNLSKINGEVIKLWAALVMSIPQARLLIKAPALTDESTAQLYARRLVDAGIPKERFELLGRTASTNEHLALYGRIDIALDPFPYNGTTTTCEALYMGVPVVTLVGGRHAGRVGLSLLTSVGVPAWAARTADDYTSIARAISSDCEALGELRTALRKKVLDSSLCDRASFAANVERTYSYIWSTHGKAE